MDIYISRHGQTEDNVNHVVQGQADSALTEAGIQSLKKRAGIIQSIHFDAIYCSPLQRAQQSLEILLNERVNDPEIILTNAIMEIDFGIYTKKKQAAIVDIIRQHKANNELPYPEGESGRQLKDRVMTFFHALLNSGQQSILMVTHFGVIETILSHYNVAVEKIRENSDRIVLIQFNADITKYMWLEA